jgi:dihydroflavonol-4-reductase
MPAAFITGATGCLGSNLCRLLTDSGWSIHTFQRSPLPLVSPPSPGRRAFAGDITDESILIDAARGCDVVFHTAAIVSFSRAVREERYRVNVLGTRALVRACRAAQVPLLVHTSSVAAIGSASPGEEADENTPLARAGLSGYKQSKVLAEDEVRRGIDAGLRAIIVNPAVIIGEGDTRFHGGELLRSIRNGMMPGYVSGGMNLVAVHDVARAMIAAVSKGRAGERYILGGENLTHKEIFERTAALINGMPPIGEIPRGAIRVVGRVVESVFRMIGKEPPLTADLADLAGRTMWYSSEKAKRELGYTTMSFDEMISRAYGWYRKNGLL